MNFNQIKILKKPLFKRIISRPLKYYFRMSSITFGLCSLANLVSCVVDRGRSDLMIEHPEITIMSIFTKSCYYGLLWPAFYFGSVITPKNTLMIYSGFESKD